MVKAIVTALEAGSITTVIPKGGVIVTPPPPYVVVWESAPIPQAGNYNRGQSSYYVSVHMPKGFTDELEDYIIDEVRELLDNELLTTRAGNKLTLDCTMNISGIIEGNDDNTISRERELLTVAIF